MLRYRCGRSQEQHCETRTKTQKPLPRGQRGKLSDTHCFRTAEKAADPRGHHWLNSHALRGRALYKSARQRQTGAGGPLEVKGEALGGGVRGRPTKVRLGTFARAAPARIQPRCSLLCARKPACEPLIAPLHRLQRPQTLFNNHTHPPPEKKFAQKQRRRRKRARRGLGRPISTCTSPTARARSEEAAGRWRAQMPQQHRHCKFLLQNGCGVSVACARGPFLREDANSSQRPRSRS